MVQNFGCINNAADVSRFLLSERDDRLVYRNVFKCFLRMRIHHAYDKALSEPEEYAMGCATIRALRDTEDARHNEGTTSGLKGVLAYDIITSRDIWRHILEFAGSTKVKIVN